MIIPVLVAVSALASAPITVAFNKFVLPNGMTVVLHEDHSVPRVHMSMRYNVGSSREQAGRTGFAHLFEHLMFEGSKHVPEGKFDQWLEAAGAENNAYTSEDETYYFEEMPSNAVELALFLESDRQGFFLDTLDVDLVDGQRDVVKNERRQSYENRPWGNAELLLPAALWPSGHPYSWPVIGSMDDLTAASITDVRAFFSTYYAPGNAIFVIVGDFDTATMKRAVTRWFSDVPARGAPPTPRATPVALEREKRVVVEDAHAPLARLQISWPTVELFHVDDAALDVVADVLGDSASSRLKRRLINELHVAQEVTVSQHSQQRAGTFTIDVVAQADIKLATIVAAIDTTVRALMLEGPTAAELQRAQAKVETNLADSLDSLAQKAARLSAYEAALDHPDAFEQDLQRYKNVSAADVKNVIKRYLHRGRVVMSVVPRGQLKLAAMNYLPTGAGGAR